MQHIDLALKGTIFSMFHIGIRIGFHEDDGEMLDCNMYSGASYGSERRRYGNLRESINSILPVHHSCVRFHPSNNSPILFVTPSSCAMELKPKPQFVVKILMKRKDDTVKTITARKAGQPDQPDVPCFVYACPRERHCKNDASLITFPKGRGWRTPYSHLISCIAGGDEEQLLKIYRSQIDSKDTNSTVHGILSYFEANMSTTASIATLLLESNLLQDIGTVRLLAPISCKILLPMSGVQSRENRSDYRSASDITAGATNWEQGDPK